MMNTQQKLSDSIDAAELHRLAKAWGSDHQQAAMAVLRDLRDITETIKRSAFGGDPGGGPNIDGMMADELDLFRRLTPYTLISYSCERMTEATARLLIAYAQTTFEARALRLAGEIRGANLLDGDKGVLDGIYARIPSCWRW